VEESWLNPEFATDQLITVALIILASLLILPVVFGALVYTMLTVIHRLEDFRRTRSRDHTEFEE
jgi:hypothetical protein